jgi:hypothetical protein
LLKEAPSYSAPPVANADGQLSGFERTQELARSTIIAAEVAAAAQRFGQDHISVISSCSVLCSNVSPFLLKGG